MTSRVSRHATSLSSRRAWIEIIWRTASSACLRRSPHGERGLKLPVVEDASACLRRSPHGERGLKCQIDVEECGKRMSLSSRRAWIEIPSLRQATIVAQSLSSRRAWIEIRSSLVSTPDEPSLSSRRAWIEITLRLKTVILFSSLSSRRAWIEISRNTKSRTMATVALLTESVD